MGYLFLLIAVLAGATKGYCGKKTSGFMTEYTDSILANVIRMVLCTAIGLVMVAALNPISDLFAFDGGTMWIMLLSGVANSAFVVLWLVSVKRGAYMMLDVFCMLGILIPMIGCAVLFDEKILPKNIVAVILLLISVCIMCSYNNVIKEKLSIASFVLLLFCSVASGMSDFSQKLFVKTNENGSIAVFNFYTSLFSTVILILCYFLFSATGKKHAAFPFKSIFPYILVMSICLFANSYFKTLAAKHLDAAVLYPLSQGSSLFLSTVMSAVLFKERLTPKCIVGIVIAFVALCINVLA